MREVSSSRRAWRSEFSASRNFWRSCLFFMASMADCLACSALASSISSARIAVSASILSSLAEISAKPPPMVTSLSSEP